ncbi:MAG: hypothetical protein A2X78_02490 [Gammaproteobacteria bacterium GWE2_37_16]|nr:MAG: hypothetical protein A2X78_02490 [Gammaproteobacteria bacterium GWE2_37_16]
MGSDDLFHKPKERKLESLGRRRGFRNILPRILILCEDSKSSKYYFEEICKEYKLQKIVVIKHPDTAPCKIVECAKQHEAEYDKIFCVFDYDDKDESYKKALNLIGKTKKIIPITSHPSFEYWLLLHHVLHEAPFHKTGNHSIGEMVERELKKHINDYSKDAKNIFQKTKDKLEIAIQHAKQRLRACESYDARKHLSNPSTFVHELIEYLQGLKI